ncbi:hypothetical protein AA0616_1400 [Komagataeibacter nataicola NRIC 0616]|nr:hypothetical protein AA0616_1400 [Komagataeibacter nataicola NRIC 0616]
MWHEKNAALPSVKALLGKRIRCPGALMRFDNETYTFADAPCKLKRKATTQSVWGTKAGISYDGWQHDLWQISAPDHADQGNIRP